ncbi:MAG: hypothetical protein IJ560_02670 [Alphaproteobacteria bacterium]|nr:hypothetical protein [Alphaproteobacteria bacterium]
MFGKYDNKQILKDIKEYRKLHGRLSRRFNTHDYMKSERLMDRGINVLKLVRDNIDNISPSDMRVCALVINTFAGLDRNELLRKLQKQADFNVIAFVRDYDQPAVKRAVAYMHSRRVNVSGNVLRKRANNYKQVCNKLHRNFESHHRNRAAAKYRSEAYDYAYAVANGFITINPADYTAAYDYINTVCFPHIDGDVADIAKQRIRAAMNANTADVVKPKKSTRKPASRRAHAPTVQEHTDGPIAHQEEKQPRVKNVDMHKFRRAIFTGASAVMVASVIAIGIVFGVKTGKRYYDTKRVEPNKKEVRNKNVVKTPVNTVLLQDVMQPVVDSADAAHITAMRNYYNSAIDIFAKPAVRDSVINNIDRQIAQGNILVTPEIGRERIAYAYFIYREYGIRSDILELAINGGQKLSPAQQQELEQTILDAGERGTGVQKMARERVNARGGTMSSHSKFKNATPQQQRQHLKNLMQLRKLNHR